MAVKYSFSSLFRQPLSCSVPYPAKFQASFTQHWTATGQSYLENARLPFLSLSSPASPDHIPLGATTVPSCPRPPAHARTHARPQLLRTAGAAPPPPYSPPPRGVNSHIVSSMSGATSYRVVEKFQGDIRGRTSHERSYRILRLASRHGSSGIVSRCTMLDDRTSREHLGGVDRGTDAGWKRFLPGPGCTARTYEPPGRYTIVFVPCSRGTVPK